MNEENFDLSHDEKLQAENDFLKLKLMLEHDAKFSTPDEDAPALSPEIENAFLNRIIAFEEQAKNPKYIKVFDRIERPVDFKPSTEIPDEQIEAEWRRLQERLYKYQIVLDVCSPNISARELYRFTTEELFEYEMDDMHVPGMISNFIYDEFHPDYVYDNSRTACDCIRQMLMKEAMEWTHDFRKESLRLNKRFPLTIEAFKNITSYFKNSYDQLEVENIEHAACDITESICTVTGRYSITATSDHQLIMLNGNWIVKFDFNEEWGYWNIYEIQIEGINL